jgi:hypothetical protein
MNPEPLDAIPAATPPVDARRRRLVGLLMATTGVLLACGGGGSDTPAPMPPPPPPGPPPVPVDGPAWWGFGRNAQHTALGELATQPLTRIAWQTPMDLAPQYTTGGALLIHYGSPVITRQNTVVLPVKTGATEGFRIEARLGGNGSLLWSLDTDYRLPPHNWVPSFNPVLTPANRVVLPAAGGRLLMRDTVNAASGTLRRVAFFGNATYAAAPATYDATVYINTPLTSDSQGNLYFGFTVTGANPAGLAGGIARVSAGGTGSWVAASVAAADVAMAKTQTNCAPALSADEATVYVVVNTAPAPGVRASGRLLALDSTSLATRAAVRLLDPATGAPAWISDNATSSPMVGPDGDVYIGVLESNPPDHNYRGWLLHFDATLAQSRTPASFGWDNTPSVVPAAMLPAYTGGSPYLLAIKYNNYGFVGGGDGRNRVAVVDPRRSQADPILAAVSVMREVITILGPTADPEWPPSGVKEWCINTAAVDPLTDSILINSEDGLLYRWHLPSNSFTESIGLNSGYAQSYTPTAIGPDGRVYAVNNATLFSVGR